MSDSASWLEAWCNGFNAHCDNPELEHDGHALLAAATRGWENSGSERAKRMILAAGAENGDPR